MKTSSDAIEVHFDEKRGRLELDCEPEAFVPYRALARQQLEALPELPFDKVIEIHVTDTAAYVARRDSTPRVVPAWISVAAVVVVLVFAIIGLSTVLRRAMD